MADIDLSKRFPSMTPVTAGPTLFRVNGCGVGVFGKRDVDPETGYYIKTWCICLLFVPILCLRAYRVSDAQKGWYFLGREPLSFAARAWNLFLIVGIAATVGLVQYDNYLTSPEHRMEVRMAAARQLTEQGHLAEAAQTYQKVAIDRADGAGPAAAAVRNLIDNQCQQAPLPQCAGVFAAAAQIAQVRAEMSGPDVAAAGVQLVTARGDSDPASAEAILDAIRPLVDDPKNIDDIRLTLLKKLVAMEPNNLDVIVALAAILQDRDQLDEAKKLLMPVKEQLGTGDGARVLGSILANEGDIDGAYALLSPYVKIHLDSLHQAETSFDATYKRLQDGLITQLDAHQGGGDFDAKYANANDDQKHALVNQFIDDHLKNNPAFLVAQAALDAQMPVVRVALELGIVTLQRAQEQSDPAVRKTQLQEAQNVFLAIEGVAGQSDAYRMSLGQVYYWLGKQADGRKLFDDYLAAKNRTTASLLEVAARLRSVGSDSEARTLGEEAYTKGATNQDRYEAAAFRALCYVDLDDQIDWLKKADPADAAEKASLAEAMGDKALQMGRNVEAAQQYEAAIDAYSAMPRSSTTLNETAIGYFGIFQANGDRASFDKCVDYFQQAVDMNPSDTTLIYNAGVTLLDGALTNVIGNRIDLHALRDTGDVGLLGYLYNNQAGRKTVVDSVNADPGIARALSYLQKVIVLAPKRADGYSMVFGVTSFTRDQTALAGLEQHILAAAPDTSQELAYILDMLKGTKDQELLAQGTAGMKRYQQVAQETRVNSPVTAAVALDDQVGEMLALDDYGQTIDADQLVSLAQDAQTLAPCSTSTSMLIDAHLFHAMKDLCRSNADFAAFCAAYHRTLGADDLIAYAASEPGPFQALVLQNAEVKSAIAMMQQQDAQFPDNRSAQEWALLKNADPGAAAKAAEIILANPTTVAIANIAGQLHPSSGGAALQSYWLLQIQNKPDEAKAVLRNVANSGVPVPVPQ